MLLIYTALISVLPLPLRFNFFARTPEMILMNPVILVKTNKTFGHEFRDALFNIYVTIHRCL